MIELSSYGDLASIYKSTDLYHIWLYFQPMYNFRIDFQMLSYLFFPIFWIISVSSI